MSLASMRLEFSSIFCSLSFSASLPSGVFICFLAAASPALRSSSASLAASFSAMMSASFFFFLRWMALGLSASPSSSPELLSHESLTSSSSSSPSHLSETTAGALGVASAGSKSSSSGSRRECVKYVELKVTLSERQGGHA